MNIPERSGCILAAGCLVFLHRVRQRLAAYQLTHIKMTRLLKKPEHMPKDD
jgi:hypothetical protein